MYIKEDGRGGLVQAPYSPRSLKGEYPNTSFPKDMSAAQLAEFNVYKVVNVTAPTADVVTKAQPAKVNGVWTQQWNERDFNSAEIQKELKDKKQRVIDGAQSRLDRAARQHGYDSMLSACSYTSSIIPRYKMEADYCVALRDATWFALETLLADVLAGNTPMPESYADVKQYLPKIVWPT